MLILGDQQMSYEQVIDTCVQVPTRDQIVKNDTAVNAIWKPISHSSFVSSLSGALESRGLKVLDSSFALNKSGHLLVGGLRLTGDVLPAIPGNISAEYEMFLRHANDMSRGIQVNAGLNMMACTNGVMTGEVIARHKHTNNFDVNVWARDIALPEFIQDCMKQTRNIEELRNIECSDDQAARCILEAGCRQVIPKARGFDIWEEWKNPVFSADDFEPGTAWKLMSDFTHVAQKCQPARQLQIVQAASPLVREFCINAAIPVEAGLF